MRLRIYSTHNTSHAAMRETKKKKKRQSQRERASGTEQIKGFVSLERPLCITNYKDNAADLHHGSDGPGAGMTGNDDESQSNKNDLNISKFRKAFEDQSC